MKKSVALLLIPALILCFSGCTNHKENDLGNRSVIQGIGVDYEGEQYTLTMQVFNLSQAGPSGAESSENVTTLYTSSGGSISEAINGIRRFVGKNPMYSHNRVLVVSENAAGQGLRDILDYFIRDYSTRPSIAFAVTRGKAADIMKADFGDATIPAEEITRLLESQSKKARVQVINVVNRYLSPGIDPVAPDLEIVENEPDEGTSVQTAGVAVMQDDRICGYLDGTQAQVMLLIDGNIKRNDIDISIPEFGNIGLYFVDCKSDTNVGLDGGIPYANIQIDVRFDINEIQNSPQELTKEKIEYIRVQIEEYFTRTCQQVLEDLLQKYQCDAFGFGRAMMKSETEYFKSVSDNWREVLPSIRTAVKLNVEIRRAGHEDIRMQS